MIPIDNDIFSISEEFSLGTSPRLSPKGEGGCPLLLLGEGLGMRYLKLVIGSGVEDDLD